jgi:hypothetical protein
MTCNINGNKLPLGINEEASNEGERRGKPLDNLT